MASIAIALKLWPRTQGGKPQVVPSLRSGFSSRKKLTMHTARHYCEGLEPYFLSTMNQLEKRRHWLTGSWSCGVAKEVPHCILVAVAQELRRGLKHTKERTDRRSGNSPKLCGWWVRGQQKSSKLLRRPSWNKSSTKTAKHSSVPV